MYCKDDETLCIISFIFFSISAVSLVTCIYQLWQFFRSPLTPPWLLKLIQVSNSLFFLSSSLHYILLTQKIDEGYIFMEFLLYFDFSITAYYFLQQISLSDLKTKIAAKIGKILIYLNILLLASIIIYFTALLFTENHNYRNCKAPLWIMTRSGAIVLVIIYLGIGIKASFWLKMIKNNHNAMINKQAEQDVWYFIHRILIIVMFVSVAINFITFVFPFISNFQDCNLLENPEDPTRVALFIFIRISTHFLPIWLSLFVFWYSRQEDKPDYLRFSHGTFTTKSWESFTHDGNTFRATLTENIN